ncbi:MAG: hypothetical protein DRI84_05015 [Bacteroidetes bacterium]|nr:MAG: hypothetical protein DRI84_05015 [Bacteroidota bacterium]
MSKKISLNNIKNFLASKNMVLLSNSYLNNKQKLCIKCPKGHIFYMSWNGLTHGYGCRECYIEKRTLDISYVKNKLEQEGYILLSGVYKNSKSSLTIKCPNNHVYITTWDNFQQGNRCKQCFIGSMKHDFNYVKEYIESFGYSLLSDNYVNANYELEIMCNNGHIYKATFSNFLAGRRCHICDVENKKLDIDYIRKKVEGEGYKLHSTSYINAQYPLTVECDKGHVYNVRWYNFHTGYRCPLCNNKGFSKQEHEVLDYINKIYSGLLLKNNRSIIKPYELDIVLSDKKLAVEYCGLYWHSELAGKDKNYHLNKLNMCNEQGYQLLTIFEDEWVNKREIVESRLLNILGSKKLETIYARKCVIKEITPTEARVFCEQNHLQGYTGSRIKLGAFYAGELVSVMTFAKPSISKGANPKEPNVWELSRFCSKINFRVIGIASKLLKHFERNYDWNTVFSYADRRWSNGNVYEKLGFELSGITKPNYWYVKRGKRIHRFGLRKKPSEPKNITEWELRQQDGWNRIWDCGNLKYKKEN